MGLTNEMVRDAAKRRAPTVIEVWKGRAHWHWHFKSGNGRIVADAENFPSKGNAIRAAKRVVTAVLEEWGTYGQACSFNRMPDQGDGITRFRARPVY